MKIKKSSKNNYLALCKRPIDIVVGLDGGEVAAAGLMVGVPLAGLGLSIYFAAKQRWLAAALTFFVGAPAATFAAAAVGGLLLRGGKKPETDADVVRRLTSQQPKAI